MVMSPEVAVHRAIARAERVLPGKPAAEGKRDPRWQAIIRVGEFIEPVLCRTCTASHGGSINLVRLPNYMAG